MAVNQTRFQAYLEQELKKYRGVYVPTKSGILRRMLIRKASCEKLHPNPHDAFCDPKVGPAYEIVSKYEQDIWTAQQHAQTNYFKEPLIVERIHPDGYMILNGHHRWAAALMRNLNTVPIRIVNLTHEGDIERMLKNARHTKLASMDLDEVVFLSDPKEPEEKALPLPAKKVFKERLRLGVPALFRFLKTEGYDIWVYSAKNYSMDDIQRYFAWCRVKIDGIVTGVGRMERSSEVKKKLETRIKSQYPHIIHIDRLTLLRTSTASRGYEEFPLSGEALTWSQEVMDIVGALEKHEK